MTFEYEIEKRKKLIDGAITEILDQYKDKESGKLMEAIKYSVNGGKRIRSILTLMVYEMFGNELNENIINLACAIEFIHSASLILDDLPCMDNSEYRRSKETTHMIYGESTTILASAALLTLAFDLFSRVNSNRLNEIVGYTAKIVGLRGMIMGQFMDVKSFNKNNTIEKLNEDYQLKTGLLFCDAVKIAGLLADGNEEEIKALENYGACFGRAYQIRDDILDIEGNEKELGKPINVDLKNKKITYPALIGIDKSKKIILEEVNKAKNFLSIFGGRANNLAEMLGEILLF